MGISPETTKPQLERVDVVQHLARVGRLAAVGLARLDAQLQQHELLGRGECPLDTAREDGLTAEQRLTDEQRADEAAGGAGQTAERVVGIRQQPHRGRVERQRPGHRPRHEGQRAVARHQPPGAICREIRALHGILGT